MHSTQFSIKVTFCPIQTSVYMYISHVDISHTHLGNAFCTYVQTIFRDFI